MISKGSKNTVKFSLKAPPQARKVCLAGDFNSWKPVDMKKQKDGAYCATLELKSGTYQYKFIVDGNWVTDPDQPRMARNPYGSMNSMAQI